MSKLTLPILCAYLPYGLEIINTAVNRKYTLEFGHLKHLEDKIQRGTTHNKLLLRPLSSLTKPITHNGETFVPVDYLLRDISPSYSQECFNQDKAWVLNDGYRAIGEFPHRKVQKLIEWNFDVFGGIDSGWALPIEELTANQEKA